MDRIICLAVGYMCGLLQSGYIYGKVKKVDIRNYGSGNSGTTNAMRVLGKKAGMIVFICDFLKAFIPCMAIRFFFRSQTDMIYLLIIYTGLGVILGHNYPIYLKFKGGKGIAATGGMITAVDIRLGLVCLAAFAVAVLVTKYVSVGSLVVASITFLWLFLFARNGNYGLGNQYLIEFYIIAAVITGLAFWRHRANISRLIHGNENKTGSGKK